MAGAGDAAGLGEKRLEVWEKPPLEGVNDTGPGVACFSGSLVFAASLGALGLEKRPWKGVEEEGRGCCSPAGLLGVAGFANKPPKGFAGAFVCSESAVAGGLGSKRFFVDEVWNKPVEGAAGAGEAVASLLANREPGVVVDAENWNGDLGCDSAGFGSSFFSSMGFCDVEGVVWKRFDDWKGFWNGVEGFAGEAAPNNEDDAGAAVVAAGAAGVEAEGVGVAAPPNNDVEGVVALKSKTGLEGVSAADEADAPNNEVLPAPAKLG